MTLQTFVRKYDVEYSTNLIKKEELIKVSDAMGVQIGKELADYILEYGYLAFEYSELYGINSRQFLESDMVKQTIYLHSYYPETSEFIAIENQGDGDYYLVDRNDYIYEFDVEMSTLTPTFTTLYEHILNRFELILDEKKRQEYTRKQELV